MLKEEARREREQREAAVEEREKALEEAHRKTMDMAELVGKAARTDKAEQRAERAEAELRRLGSSQGSARYVRARCCWRPP